MHGLCFEEQIIAFTYPACCILNDASRFKMVRRCPHRLLDLSEELQLQSLDAAMHPIILDPEPEFLPYWSDQDVRLLVHASEHSRSFLQPEHTFTAFATCHLYGVRVKQLAIKLQSRIDSTQELSCCL